MGLSSMGLSSSGLSTMGLSSSGLSTTGLSSSGLSLAGLSSLIHLPESGLHFFPFSLHSFFLDSGHLSALLGSTFGFIGCIFCFFGILITFSSSSIIISKYEYRFKLLLYLGGFNFK